MKIAITGANGQLGKALAATFAPEHEVIALGHDRLELASPAAIGQIVATGATLVLHPAAYTNVDGCARDPQLAYRINGLGTRYVALACQQLGAPLVYISTNEVFSGAASQPYMEYDATGPINAYGVSKLVGERAVREVLPHHYIVRVAWLFGGERNFPRTVLRLAASPPQGGMRIVADEVGSPTYTPDVAAAVVQLVQTNCYGTYHFVNSGVCSRHELALETMRLGGFSHVPVAPITLAEFRRDSSPPPYSPLANVAGEALGISFRPWQEALAEFLATNAER
ncbi:MAG: dTDP-4-dehydrorhamnose reductase [Chloroflexaceae bacterium]|jgi:dTDP-4-dehydrorhamnose reductase|nr:dTDP-4-dehydrorhamnose reductase [Chloroflexaceae bacterium]